MRAHVEKVGTLSWNQPVSLLVIFETSLDNEVVVSFIIVSSSILFVLSVSDFLFPYSSKVWVTVVVFFFLKIYLTIFFNVLSFFKDIFSFKVSLEILYFQYLSVDYDTKLSQFSLEGILSFWVFIDFVWKLRGNWFICSDMWEVYPYI